MRYVAFPWVFKRVLARIQFWTELFQLRIHFDRHFYLSTYPQVDRSGFGAIEHYCIRGWREGLNPHPDFDTLYYLGSNPDVEKSGINPYLHFILHGRKEGRRPKATHIEDHELAIDYLVIAPEFDINFYLSHYPDVKDARVDPVKHFITGGWREFRNPTKDFDTRYYYSSNRDAIPEHVNPFRHYLEFGRQEGLLGFEPAVLGEGSVRLLDNQESNISPTSSFSLQPPGKRRLLYFPDYTTTNPYQTLLYKECGSAWEVSFGTINDALELASKGRQSDTIVFHLHWPEPIFSGIQDADPFRVRAHAFLTKIRQFQSFGGQFIWTIHNKLPHDLPCLEHHIWFNEQLASLADLIHVHAQDSVDIIEQTFQLVRKRCVVIPHGSFVDYYPNTVSRSTSRDRLGLPQSAFVMASIGQLRPYKGLEPLVRAFSSARMHDSSLQLLVAGKPVFPTRAGYWTGLQNITPGLSAVEGYIPDDDLQFYFNAADVIVLPYNEILTSGSLMLAASFGKPIIAPDLPALRNYNEVGFVLTYKRSDLFDLFRTVRDFRQLGPEKLDELSAKALSFARSKNWDQISHQFFQVLNERLIAPANTLNIAGKDVDVVQPPSPAVDRFIGVAIVNYRSADEVESLIATIPPIAAAWPVRIYIMDNDTDNAQVTKLRRIAPSACIVRSRTNLGYAGGNNVLINLMRQEGAQYIFIVNPDVRVGKSALDELLTFAKGHSQCFISPAVLTDEGGVSFAGGTVHKDRDIRIHHRNVGEPFSRLGSVPYETDVLNGCAVLFSTHLLNVVGDLPEEYFLYFEETEWFLKAKEKGIRCFIVPTARVVHTKQSHGHKVPTAYYVYYFLRNTLIFNRRNGGSVEVAENRITKEFIEGWRTTIIRNAAGYLSIFDRCVSAAIEDGRNNMLGRVDIGSRLDRVASPRPWLSQGFVESFTGSLIIGWAAKRGVADSDHSPVWTADEVWLLVDDVPVASTVPKEHRPDVAAKGFGNVTGFSLEVPLHLRDCSVRKIEVRSAGDGKRLGFLSSSSQAEPLARRIQFLECVEAAPKIRARIDGIHDGAVGGWAYDDTSPGRAVVIDVRVNQQCEIRVVADLYRPDLQSAGFANGRHGFKIALPNRILAEVTLTVSISVTEASGKKTVLAERTLNDPMHAGGFDPRLDAQRFLQWAYLDGDMPIGIYSSLSQIKMFFDLEMERHIAMAATCHEKPLVTVVMPAFDRVSSIDASIRSVLAQSYRNFELIVVDDGSSDGTAELVQSLFDTLGDSRVRLLRHQSNRGVSAARNTALKESCGEIITYLDSDNTWHPSYIAIVVDRVASESESIAVYAGQEIWEVLPYFNEIELRRIRACPFNRSKLERRNFIDLNVFAHKRECIDRYGMFREDMSRLVDWELILRYTNELPPIFVPVLLNKYFINRVANQVTQTVEYGSNRQIIYQFHGPFANRV